MHISFSKRSGFALPTVLIASVVLLTILVTASTSVAAVRNSLKAQYYEQLAKSAGEAGVAYAKACLSKNSNMPLWTDAKPLTPSTDCAGNELIDTETACPANSICSVVYTGSLRSSFKVGRPVVDGNGRAITIPHTGYVELLRSSNGAVWRTYKQPAAQSAAVPDLCSGAATTPLGWSNAVISSQQSAIPNAASARSISIADGNVIAGSTYYQKGFTVSEAGNYNLDLITNSNLVEVRASIDGGDVFVSRGGLSGNPITLSAGCHVITAKLTNKVPVAAPANFTAAVRRNNAQPIVATDSSWRVSSGMAVSFSNPDFYADPSVWVGSTNAHANISVYEPWTSKTGGDTSTVYITAGCVLDCPGDSHTFFRDNSDFVLTASDDKNDDGVIDILVTTLCDWDCRIYINDTKVIGSSPFNSGSTVVQQTISLPPGRYRIAAQVWNDPTTTSANPSAFAMMLTNRENSGTIIRNTNTSWLTPSNKWIPGFAETSIPMSYEASFNPHSL